MELRRSEIWRYLGYRGKTPGEREQREIERVALNMQRYIVPRHIYSQKPCVVFADRVQIEGVIFQSRMLARALAQCEEVLLLAATLGSEADQMVRRYQVQSMADAAIAQAVCAEMLESYLDGICAGVAKQQEQQGLFLGARFSPGYGDLALESQKEFFALLDCTRRLGISLTAGGMMTPTKSVTAFLGLSRVCRKRQARSCDVCDRRECAFRRGK